MFKLDLQRYKLPESYRRGGRECFLDPVRQRLIVQTPEKIVRQQVVEFLCEALKVPRHCIELEIPMSDFEKGAKGRADKKAQAHGHGDDQEPVRGQRAAAGGDGRDDEAGQPGEGSHLLPPHVVC